MHLTREGRKRFEHLFVSSAVYEKTPRKHADGIREKLLDLLEQAFPNPMSVSDLAK